MCAVAKNLANRLMDSSGQHPAKTRNTPIKPANIKIFNVYLMLL